jgi:trans-aconitate 2-methyltransferase
MDCTLALVPDWDAAHYHQVADPQTRWGLKVLERLRPRDGERILDIGCGTGRLTLALAENAPGATVIATDVSPAMVREARKALGGRVPVVHANGVCLPFRPGFDAVFSTATFHWIHDHVRLFAEIQRVLQPGGRLVSQAGGGPNLRHLYGRCDALAKEREFAGAFTGWTDPWYFANVEETIGRLRGAGFDDISVWLEETPTGFSRADEYRAFVKTVCLRHQLARLDETRREHYLDRLVEAAAEDDPAFTLDYWRLNIDARKP